MNQREINQIVAIRSKQDDFFFVHMLFNSISCNLNRWRFRSKDDISESVEEEEEEEEEEEKEDEEQLWFVRLRKWCTAGGVDELVVD